MKWFGALQIALLSFLLVSSSASKHGLDDTVMQDSASGHCASSTAVVTASLQRVLQIAVSTRLANMAQCVALNFQLTCNCLTNMICMYLQQRDVHLASISGGTDILGCFMLGRQALFIILCNIL
jgi:hypothetical protein